MRLVVAIIVGVSLTLLLAYAALVGFVLATVGIPLGAQSEPTSPSGYMTMLVLGAVAAAIGGRVAVRLGRISPSRIVAGMTVALTVLMVWGFSGRNSWPDWWGPVASGVMVVGACIGGLGRRRRGRLFSADA